MNYGHALRGACVLLTLMLGACGNSDNNTGLLDSTNTGTASSRYRVTLDGPDCVEPGVVASGYTATVTTLSGSAAKDVFVALTATAGSGSVGTIRATQPDGKTRLAGANTGASGVVPFTFTPPSDAIRNSVLVTITATVMINGAAAGTVDYPIELQPTTQPSISVQGPKDGAGVRGSSAGVTAASGQLLPDFLVTVSRPASGCGTAGPIAGATITVTPKIVGAAARVVDATTLIDGTAAFDYVAPTVTVATAETLSVTASVNGVTSAPASFALTVAPPPPPAATVVSIAGPASGSPNIAQAGYTATVQTVASDGTRLARENTALLISLSDGGTVTLQPNSAGQLGTTDRFGQVKFSITPKSTTAPNTSITVTAKADSSSDAVLATSCTQTVSTCSGALKVLVQPDSFQFTAPIFGSSGTVGTPNAVPLAFQWSTSAGAGVPGCINLNASLQGTTTASTDLLIINGDPVPAAQTRLVQLGSDGRFQVPVQISSDRSGFVQVTATENRNCVAGSTSGALTASSGVQFVDQICTTTSDGRNCVDLNAPLRTLSSPDTSGAQVTVPLDFSVLNNAYQPIDGAQVLFSITSPASSGDPNERVFPGGGTTDANGKAASQYYVPTFTPALASGDVRFVTVQACVRQPSNSSSSTAQVCSSRQIQIVGPP